MINCFSWFRPRWLWIWLCFGPTIAMLEFLVLWWLQQTPPCMCLKFQWNICLHMSSWMPTKLLQGVFCYLLSPNCWRKDTKTFKVEAGVACSLSKVEMRHDVPEYVKIMREASNCHWWLWTCRIPPLLFHWYFTMFLKDYL